MTQSVDVFSALQIAFSQANHASVFFAHLQNTLSQFKTVPEQTIQFNKIDHILFDIFNEHKKLEKEYLHVSTTFKEMMGQFTTMMNEMKADREQLLKVSEDRQLLLQKLKQSTDSSIEIMEENQKLRDYVQKITQLNKLISEKNGVLEEQIQNVKLQHREIQSFQNIRSQYDRLTESNSQMRKQLQTLTKETQVFSVASIPLQIVCLAFKDNEKIRDEIWQTVVTHNKQKFSDLEYIRQKFYGFDYGQIINK